MIAVCHTSDHLGRAMMEIDIMAAFRTNAAMLRRLIFRRYQLVLLSVAQYGQPELPIAASQPGELREGTLESASTCPTR